MVEPFYCGFQYITIPTMVADDVFSRQKARRVISTTLRCTTLNMGRFLGRFGQKWEDSGMILLHRLPRQRPGELSPVLAYVKGRERP